MILGGMLGAALVAGSFVAPAIGATEKAARLVRQPAVAARALASFTPAAADPRLAAVFARGGLDGAFRFTPAETRSAGKAVTVAVRTRSNRAPADDRSAAVAPTVGLAPIAYNLGVAVGWKRFAVSGDLAKVDLGGQPGARDTADVAVTYAGNRSPARSARRATSPARTRSA